MKRVSALLIALITIDLILVAWVLSIEDSIKAQPKEVVTEKVIEKTVVKEPYEIFSDEGEKIVREYCKNSAYNPNIPLSEDVQEYINLVANAYSIDPMLITAVIEKESYYTEDLVSPTDDYGFMQVNKVNADWLKEDIGVSNLLDPYENIHAGCHILAGLFEKYEEVSLVLMAYNMGEAGAKRCWSNGIFESNYSRAVLEIFGRLTDEDR